MKIEQKDKGFNPITLTIESQEELDLLSDLFSLVSGKLGHARLNDAVYSVGDVLVELGANTNYTYIDGWRMKVVLK